VYSAVVGQVVYPALNHTPVVKFISPNNGTALGGSQVTLNGFNLSPSVGAENSTGMKE
jgi:hypothetical protein